MDTCEKKEHHYTVFRRLNPEAYAEERKKIAENIMKRYNTDPEFRKAKNEYAKQRYYRLKAEKEALKNAVLSVN